jgi:hypothetical protein
MAEQMAQAVRQGFERVRSIGLLNLLPDGWPGRTLQASQGKYHRFSRLPTLITGKFEAILKLG